MTICLLISYTISCLHNSPSFSLKCAGSLELKTHMVCLGRHMLTLEEKTWEIGFAGSLFWSPLGWVRVTCSQWFRRMQCLWLNSRAGEFWDVFKLLTRNLNLLQQHHEPCCQWYTERGNHASMEIPCLFLGQHRVCSKEKTSGSAQQTQLHFGVEQRCFCCLRKRSENYLKG